MIVVKVELHNANTGEISEIGRAIIANVGGTDELGDYRVCLGGRRRRDDAANNKLLWDEPCYEGRVEQHERLRLQVWSLVCKALAACGFGPEAGR